MTSGATLIALECVRCQTPVPAEPDEVAWVCRTCGQGLLLDEARGLTPVTVHAATGPAQGASWRPFWVVSARVRFQRRESYGRDSAPEARWSQPVQFVLPAFTCGVEQAVAIGVKFLRQPPHLEEGAAQPLQGATVLPQQLAALARFVVLTVEAERGDKLEAVEFTVDLDSPDVWCLPA
jgi:hypothetical protein